MNIDKSFLFILIEKTSFYRFFPENTAGMNFIQKIWNLRL